MFFFFFEELISNYINLKTTVTKLLLFIIRTVTTLLEQGLMHIYV
jgi:hypothetical protein